MQNTFGAKLYFLMAMSVSLYSASFCAEQANNAPIAHVSTEPDAFMSSFLKSVSDNEKVLYKDGKIAFFQAHSKLKTLLSGLGGLTLLGVGGLGTLIAFDGRRRADGELFLYSAIAMLCGAGLSAFMVHRLIKHFSKEVFIVLDGDGLIERRIRKLHWKDVHNVEIETRRIYNQYGMLISATKILHVQDKRANSLFSLSEEDESLPIPFDCFLDVLEYYWHANKANDSKGDSSEK